MTTMKVFHWFWAWDDDKEEAWLPEMAQKGWHFKSASLPGNYVFESGPPRDWQYFRKEAVDGVAPEIFSDYAIVRLFTRVNQLKKRL